MLEEIHSAGTSAKRAIKGDSRDRAGAEGAEALPSAQSVLLSEDRGDEC